MASSIAVVILNRNGKHYLEQFLEHTVAHTPNASIFVADNASDDGSVEFIENNFPQVNLIRLDHNYGYSGGYNRALKEISAEIYVLLNSDIEVTPGWLNPVIDLLNSDEKIAAAAPKIKSFAEKNKFEHAGAAGGYLDKFGYPLCRGRILHEVETDEGQYDDQAEVFWATGACLFIKSELFHKTGGFDDDFFAHMEEIDLCWRLKNAGYKIYYCPDSLVYHVGGGTLPYKSAKKVHLNFRNGLFLLYKNLPRRKLPSILFVRLLLDGIAAWTFLFQGSPRKFFAVFKAHLKFYLSLGKLNKKRKYLYGSDRKYPLLGMINKSLVYQFFIKKKKKFSDWKLN